MTSNGTCHLSPCSPSASMSGLGNAYVGPGIENEIGNGCEIRMNTSASATSGATSCENCDLCRGPGPGHRTSRISSVNESPLAISNDASSV